MVSNCPHCDPKSFALKYPLEITDDFYVVCDVHPLTKGHVLIIPKTHISCLGAYPNELLVKFDRINDKVSAFLKNNFGTVASFEHGAIGQTVFHSHVHYLPFAGRIGDIIPEGEKRIKDLQSLYDLPELFEKEKGYLYLSVNDRMYTVDPTLGQPRFFRDRFAKAIGKPERGNWKIMAQNPQLMAEAEKDIAALRQKWESFSF